jgi:hypothetical protein
MGMVRLAPRVSCVTGQSKE